MDVIYLPDDSTSIDKTLTFKFDFGNCSFANGLEAKEIHFKVYNKLSDSNIVIHSLNTFNIDNIEFPAIVEFFMFSTSGDSSKLSRFEEELEIKPLEYVSFICYFKPSVNSEEIEHPRTSFFNILSQGYLKYSFHDKLTDLCVIKSKPISIHSSLCMSVLHVDESYIDFGDCQVEEMSTYSLQVWNRSESELQYKLLQDSYTYNDESMNLNTDQNIPKVQFQTTDITRRSITLKFNETNTIPTYGSQQLNIKILSKVFCLL